MADNPPGGFRLEPAWTALTHRLAATAGALTALTALFFDAPVHFASLRGAASWAAVLLLGRGAQWAFCRTQRGARLEASAQPFPIKRRTT